MYACSLHIMRGVGVLYSKYTQYTFQTEFIKTGYEKLKEVKNEGSFAGRG